MGNIQTRAPQLIRFLQRVPKSAISRVEFITCSIHHTPETKQAKMAYDLPHQS